MTIIYHAPQRLGMLMCIFRCAPDAGQTKLPTSAHQQIFRAVHFAPGVMTSRHDQPAMGFGVT